MSALGGIAKLTRTRGFSLLMSPACSMGIREHARAIEFHQANVLAVIKLIMFAGFSTFMCKTKFNNDI